MAVWVDDYQCRLGDLVPCYHNTIARLRVYLSSVTLEFSERVRIGVLQRDRDWLHVRLITVLRTGEEAMISIVIDKSDGYLQGFYQPTTQTLWLFDDSPVHPFEGVKRSLRYNSSYCGDRCMGMSMGKTIGDVELGYFPLHHAVVSLAKMDRPDKNYEGSASALAVIALMVCECVRFSQIEFSMRSWIVNCKLEPGAIDIIHDWLDLSKKILQVSRQFNEFDELLIEFEELLNEFEENLNEYRALLDELGGNIRVDLLNKLGVGGNVELTDDLTFGCKIIKPAPV